MFLLQFSKVSARKPSTSTAADRDSEGDGFSDEEIEEIGDTPPSRSYVERNHNLRLNPMARVSQLGTEMKWKHF